MTTNTGQTEIPANAALRKFDGGLVGDRPTLELPAQEKIKISFGSQRHFSSISSSLFNPLLDLLQLWDFSSHLHHSIDD